MNPIKTIIFDLDGTLIDTHRDIAYAMNRVLLRLKLLPKPEKEYIRYIGYGTNAMVSALTENMFDSSFVHEQFLREYKKYIAYKSNVYSGILEMLETLKSHGFLIAVLTNKSEFHAKKLCKEMFPSNLFSAIVGINSEHEKKPDPHLFRQLLNTLSITESACLYVGDTQIDIETAHNVGCKFAWVSWGYQSYDQLEIREPILSLSHPRQIFNLISSLEEEIKNEAFV